ncbi:mitochondrial carrier domain-containing protein [Lipomyces arxii]|uniref:mitochondrial carrier domain-containing protein n=1 Tax=Lipomyces arxii TaxID=56418 RepID=UPI0034CE89F0
MSNTTESYNSSKSDFTSTTADITNRESVICGGIAGLVSRFWVAPMDVVKIRQQLQISPYVKAGTSLPPKPVYNGMVSSMIKIYREEGLTSLWKGNLPAELLYVIYGALQFTALHQTNMLFTTYAPDIVSPSVQYFISGAVSGAAATTVTYPLDLLRTRFAAQGSTPAQTVYPSLRSSIRQIYVDEGISGFFQGLRPALSQIAPYMGLFFASYSIIKTGVESAADNFDIRTFGSVEAIAGMIAGVISKTGVFPLDVIRKRMQIQGPTRSSYILKDIPTYPKSVTRSAIKIFAHEGVRGLYRGLWVSLLKAAPTSAITMWTFEHSVHAIRWLDSSVESF